MAFKSLLEYYQNELEFLVEEGKLFSHKYPNVAESLDFTSFNSNDPDVKRLIESIAFLNAKLQKRIDEQVPEISSQILHAIYPQFVAPIPSCTIMNFSTSVSPNTGLKIIKRDTQLTSHKEFEKQFYTFQTTMNVEISPWEISNIEFSKYEKIPREIAETAQTCLKLYINQVSPYELDNMVVYIHTIEETAHELLQAISSVLSYSNTPIFEDGIKIGEIIPIGFDESETLFPISKRENNAYKTIMEFNFFPKKFMFFKLKFFKTPKKSITIPTTLKKDIPLRKENLLLNCTPAINLFEKNSEPINITTFDTQYRLTADYNSDKAIEIHTVKEVLDTNFTSQEKYTPYYSHSHINDDCNNTFWLVNRKMRTNRSQLFISLFKNKPTQQKMLYAKLLCTQAKAGELLSANEKWNIANNPGNIECMNLDKPTNYQLPISVSQTQWRLISHLSINYFGLNGNDIINKLKELFCIYGFNTKINKNALNEIKHASYKTSMSYFENMIIPQDEIEIIVNEKNHATYLIGNVVANFLRHNTTLNSKMKLILKKQDGEIWKEMQLN